MVTGLRRTVILFIGICISMAVGSVLPALLSLLLWMGDGR